MQIIMAVWLSDILDARLVYHGFVHKPSQSGQGHSGISRHLPTKAAKASLELQNLVAGALASGRLKSYNSRA